MVLILLFLIVVTILVAVSIFRHHSSVGSLVRPEIARGDYSIAGERAGRSRIAGPVKQFLVVVLPDGTIVNPRVAAQVADSLASGGSSEESATPR
jgi:hypothetical protein